VASSKDVSSLEPVEVRLLDHVIEGTWLDLAPGTRIDKASMASWDTGRTIRATVIRDILRGRLAPDPDPHGVRIRGARVSGPLDLDSLSTKVTLELQECFLPEGLSACDACLSGVRLEGCRIERSSGAALAADRLSAPLVALNGATVVGHDPNGAVRLFGASITRVECDGADLSNDSGPALFAEALQVEQDMFLRAGFRAFGDGDQGAVCLLAARLSRLECDGADLRNCSGPAIRADSAVIDQRLCLRNGFQAIGADELGAVRLNGAQIGLLLCDGAKFVNNSGPAFAALAVSVERGIYLRGFAAEGEIHMPGVRTVRLECDGAKLQNCSGPAMFAEAIQVEQDVLLKDGFEADGLGQDGAVCLVGASIGGRLDFTGAVLINRGDGRGSNPALNGSRLAVGGDIVGDKLTCQGELCLENAQITGSIQFRGADLSEPTGWPLVCRRLKAQELVLLTAESIGGVDLRHAHIDLLRDEPVRWAKSLRLDGLSYDVLAPPGTSKQRRKWLALDEDGYRPQPYEQLASLYRKLGDDSGARDVLLAGQRRHRESLGPILKAWGYLQDGTVGYGYKPWYAMLWLIALLTVGTVAFTLGQPPPLDSSHPAFMPVIYTLDLLLPAVDFGQQDEFSPHGLQAWLAYSLIAAGWILATTIAAGITRALRRE
jgi:uncharacterized protein YjbI with pentapeptide repeats